MLYFPSSGKSPTFITTRPLFSASRTPAGVALSTPRRVNSRPSRWSSGEWASEDEMNGTP